MAYPIGSASARCSAAARRRAVARSALGAVERAAVTEIALVHGAPALVMAPFGRLAVVIRFTVGERGIREIEVIAEPERLRALEIAVL